MSGLLPGDTLLRTGLAPATTWLQQNAERAKATLHDRARVRAEEQDALQGADGLPPGAMPEGPPPPATPPPPTTVVVPVHSPGTPAAPAPAAHHHTGHTGSTGQAGSPGGTTGTPH
ncbi:MAG TPA: hypothetical protein VKY15_00535, partial [Acidimicrobiales bacterium]|nr:hypothetical protein [Acidimicrobiales bacterium]